MRFSKVELDLASRARLKPAIRTRRSKGKSRLGCVTCKARKVKCDESRPTCSQCKARSSGCTYPTNAVPSWNDQVITFTLPFTFIAETEVAEGECQNNVIHTLKDHGEAPLAITDALVILGHQIVPGMAECARLYDAQDVFLMMHFKSTTSIDLLGDPKLWAQHALQLAFQHNFLMHAVLALAARHLQDAPQLSGGHPPYDYKIREAHHLQKTLSTFSHAFNNRIHPNQDAVLATSFLLFFHMSSIIDVNPSTTHPCEDTSFTFLRGIQAVVADGSHVAHSGRYKSLVAPPAHSPVIIPRTKASPGPVALFAHLIHNLPPLSPFLQKRETYIERFESLMPHLSASTAQDLDDEPLEELLLSLLRWQALCPSLFIDMIKAHDCIALVILAHFYAAIGFIVSQVKNRWWWFQRKPHRMVENIAEHVGPAWDIWLQWPRAVVQGYQGNTTM